MDTKDNFQALGHYSQAFKANGHIWVAGQIAADIKGKLIEGSVKEKAALICKNLKEILEEAGSGLDKVVKVTVYCNDMSILGDFNEVYNDHFPHKPPRSSVEVSKLPLGVSLFVDVQALY